jgi:class 3 adenylate cyclase
VTHRVRRTFLFTDIVRSGPLVEAVGLGDEAWGDLIRWHDASLHAQSAAHGGEEVDHAGDDFFVGFETPAAAVQCTISIQHGLAAHQHSPGIAPQVRIGIHPDEALGGGGDYRGHGVHNSARVAAEAAGGENLVSAGTWEGAASNGRPGRRGRHS